MDKKICRIVISVITLIMIFSLAIPNCVQADSGSDFWQKAGEWFKKTQEGNLDENNNLTASNTAIDIVNQFMDIINYVGTIIIMAATMYQGIKYIFGSVESKSDVKESLFTLLVACIFFFGWQYIRDIIISGGNLFIASPDDTTYKPLFGRLFVIINTLVKVAAVAGVIYVGVRYIFAGADAKAELKGKSVYFIIGIILTFCSVTVITVISNVLEDMLT